MTLRSWRFAIFAMFGANGLAIGTWGARTPATAEALGLGLAQMGLLISAIPLGALLGELLGAQIGLRAALLIGVTGVWCS